MALYPFLEKHNFDSQVLQMTLKKLDQEHKEK